MNTFWVKYLSIALCGISFAACGSIGSELDTRDSPDEQPDTIASMDYGDLWRRADLIARRRVALFQGVLRQSYANDGVDKRGKHVNLGQYLENQQQAHQSDQQSLVKPHEAFQQILKDNSRNGKNAWVKRNSGSPVDRMQTSGSLGDVDKRDRVLSVEMPLRVLKTQHRNGSKKSQVAMTLSKLARIGKRSAIDGEKVLQ